ncbi:hypothetical protein F2P81_011618 [Scophthalmus maximus]|uniref:Uncharacterized protein n=1 Tax=Scophthalmus maximus TaxID=52904 RepID=A0A6A4SM64_SCOMX|nr:hypothetical protein F2P81_011618 [Scophthalmus maximus]
MLFAVGSPAPPVARCSVRRLRVVRPAIQVSPDNWLIIIIIILIVLLLFLILILDEGGSSPAPPREGGGAACLYRGPYVTDRKPTACYVTVVPRSRPSSASASTGIPLLTVTSLYMAPES